MKKLSLKQTHLFDLAELSIGMRIRYIRELLQGEFGNDFSGKSVANRLQLFSQSTLTMIERGKTKDISAQALYAIAMDFGVDLYLFFDDYYESYPVKDVVLLPAIYNSDEINDEHSKPDNSHFETNPLQENEYKIKTSISRIASNGDEQLTLSYSSQTKYSNQQLFQLISQVISQINTIDVSMEPKLMNTIKSVDSINLAADYIHHSKKSLRAFPWYPHQLKTKMENKLHESAINYTDMLLKNLKSTSENRGD